MRSFFKLLKKDSATALSQQLPLRLMLGSRSLVQRLAVLAEPQPLPASVSRDADGDHVLACARAAQVALIVSGDKDLLGLGAFKHMPILPVRRVCSSPTTRPARGVTGDPTRFH